MFNSPLLHAVAIQSFYCSAYFCVYLLISQTRRTLQAWLPSDVSAFCKNCFPQDSKKKILFYLVLPVNIYGFLSTLWTRHLKNFFFFRQEGNFLVGKAPFISSLPPLCFLIFFIFSGVLLFKSLLGIASDVRSVLADITWELLLVQIFHVRL